MPSFLVNSGAEVGKDRVQRSPQLSYRENQWTLAAALMLAFNLHEARVAPQDRDSEVDSIKTCSTCHAVNYSFLSPKKRVFPLAAVQIWQQVGCLLQVESHAKTIEMNIHSSKNLIIYYFVSNFTFKKDYQCIIHNHVNTYTTQHFSSKWSRYPI